jgi:hypothetical protein
MEHHIRIQINKIIINMIERQTKRVGCISISEIGIADELVVQRELFGMILYKVLHVTHNQYNIFYTKVLQVRQLMMENRSVGNVHHAFGPIACCAL